MLGHKIFSFSTHPIAWNILILTDNCSRRITKYLISLFCCCWCSYCNLHSNLCVRFFLLLRHSYWQHFYVLQIVYVSRCVCVYVCVFRALFKSHVRVNTISSALIVSVSVWMSVRWYECFVDCLNYQSLKVARQSFTRMHTHIQTNVQPQMHM